MSKSTIDLQKFVGAVCPDLPSTKQVKVTTDNMMWYKILPDSNTLLIPPMHYIKQNALILDKTIEALVAFSNTSIKDAVFDWDNLHLYEASNTRDMLKMIAQVKKESQYSEVACDIETRRVEWEDNRLLSIGFATDINTCYALNFSAGVAPEVLRSLQDLFDSTDISFIWHNGKFDCGRLNYLQGLNARIDEDTMLLHYCGINEKRGTHGLKDLGQLYLQAPAWDDELDRIKREYCRQHKIRISDFMYDYIPTSVLIPYMQRDCIAAMRLLYLFRKLARPESKFIYRKLIEASNAYMHVEINGMRLNVDYLEELEYELEDELKEAQQDLMSIAKIYWDPQMYATQAGAKSIPKEGFNIKSPKQLKWMLTRVLGYEVSGTDAATLENLTEQVDLGIITNPGAKAFLKAIERVRKDSKYMDTYVQGMRESLCRDLRIRGTFNLHGTETGRLSSSSPNMQNVPRDKRIKNLFCATPGYKLLQLDYSQAELRVLAMLSKDPWLTKVYQDGKDLHDAVATDMFGPNFDKEQRVMAKTINFGIAYGRGPGSIAQTFKKTMAEARAIIDKWYKPMPLVKEWIEGRRAMAKRGEACTTCFGRERHFVITNEELNHIQNEYINTPIQSIASDFTMFSLIDIQHFLEEEQLDARIITTVHDSIIIEVRDDEELLKVVAQKALQIMAETPKKYIPDCEVPFKADAEVGYTWGNMEAWQ